MGRSAQVRVNASAYPWDVAWIGVDRVLDDMVEQGVGGIDLAANYHPIEALTPRAGIRLFRSPRGGVHFPVRRERYGRIVPECSSAEVGAAWPAVAEGVKARGLELSAWTITLFQPWVADAEPSCARVLATGDSAGTGLCPANADVRELLANLCDDVVDQFGVDTVRLESVMPLGYDIDWLRPRALVTVSPLARELLTVCFCATCEERGTAAGLDVGRLRAFVLDTVARELAAPASTPLDDIAADAELMTFLDQHEQASIELVETVRVAPAVRTAKLASTIRSPFSRLRPLANKQLTAQLAHSVDQLSVAAGAGERGRWIADIAAAAPHPVGLSMLVTRGLSFPRSGVDTSDAAADPLDAHLAEARALGVDEVGLYNYGLLRDEDVRTFMDAVRRANAANGDVSRDDTSLKSTPEESAPEESAKERTP
jgi:hypothetical protein